MPENILYNLVYSLICGLTEFICVDSSSHGAIFEILSGRQQLDPWLTVWVRIGVLAALISSCGGKLRRLSRERRLSMRSRRNNRQSDPLIQLDMRFLRTAVIPVLIGVLFYGRASSLNDGALFLSLFLVLNGIYVFIPRVISRGNKDGRSVSRLDGVIVGIGSMLGALPGFSAVGGMLSAAAFRGMDRSYALDMILLLSIPVTAGLLLFDVIAAIAVGVSFQLLSLLLYLIYAAVAFGSSCLILMLMRYLSVKIGYSAFAYYSWGLALFAFIFYLII